MTKFALDCTTIVSVCLIFALGGATPPASADGMTATIALTDDAVPEENGDFSTFGNPVVNDMGNVAFKAVLKNTSGGTADDRGIYLYDGTTLVNQLREGAAAPDANGSFVNFGDPILNGTGQLAFWGFLTGTSDPPNDDTGIYLHDGEMLVNLVREDDLVPEGFGNFSSVLTTPVLNDAGQAAFFASLNGTSAGTSDDTGIYFHNGSALVNLARENGLVPEGNGLFGNFSSLLSKPVLNGAGQTAFTATLKNTSGGTADDTGIYLHNGLTLANLVRENSSVPEGNGLFNGFSEPVLNGAGQVAFLSFLKNTSGLSADNSGIYLHNGTEVVMLARENDLVPSEDELEPIGNGKFSSFIASPVLGGGGHVAFVTTLKETSGGTNDDEAIYLHNGTEVVNLVRESDDVPDGNGKFSSFDTTLLINNVGLVAFKARLKNTNGGTNNDDALYLGDEFEQIEVVREGDTLAGKIVSTINFTTNSGGEDGRATALNNLGQLAFRTRFTDGTKGVFLYTPELYWRGSAADAQWDSSANWTLSTRPTLIHPVTINPQEGLAIDGPSLPTIVVSLEIDAQTTGTTSVTLHQGQSLAVLEHTQIGEFGELNVVDAAFAAETVTIEGALKVAGASNVALFSDVVNNGIIEVNLGSSIAYFGTVAGSGSYPGTGNNFFESTFDPGAGITEFGGNVEFGQLASLALKLVGTTPGTEHNQLDIAGTASLDGELLLEVLGDLSEPGVATLTILDALSISGTFSSVPEVNDGNGAGHMGLGVFFDGINYNETSVTVDLFQAAAGDTNGDRNIDNFDIANIMLSNSFGTGYGPWDWTQGDFTGDGIVDYFDIAAILLTNLFGTGPYAASPVNLATTVPEPSSLALATLALLGLVAYRLRGNDRNA